MLLACALRGSLGDVAQLARAPALHAGGRGFESHRLHSSFVFELGHAEDVVEGRPVCLVAEPAVLHVEALEHRRVELLAGAVAGLAVGVGAAGGESSRQLQDLLPLAEVGVEVSEAVLGGSDVAADARLLGLQGRDVDRAGVVGVEELAPLRFGLGEPAGEQLALGGIGTLAFDDLGGHLLAQPFRPRCRQLDALVEVFDLGFEVFCGDVALPAGAVGIVLLAQTEEVGVAALGVLDGQAPPAHRAVQEALQVVGVLSLPRAACGAGGEQFLDPAESLGVDERLVGAGVADAVPLDDADVGRVGEELRQSLPGDRPGVPVTPGAPGEPFVGELLRQPLEGPLARRVVLESERDERGAFWVGDDAGHLVAGDHLAQVLVAERGAVGEPALLRLLAETLLDLGGEVGRVELGHERVDAFDQAPRGGLLHVLGHRDERYAPAAKERPDRHVVFHVPCQPVDLVHDDGVHVTLFGDAGQHRLEGRAVGRAGRLAPVGVLVDEAPAGVSDVAGAGLPLGGDGEALGTLALLGLLTGGHPQVEHTAHRRLFLLHRSSHEGSFSAFVQVHRRQLASSSTRLLVPVLSVAGGPGQASQGTGRPGPSGQLAQAHPRPVGALRRPDGRLGPAGEGCGGRGDRHAPGRQGATHAALAPRTGHDGEHPERHSPGGLQAGVVGGLLCEAGELLAAPVVLEAEDDGGVAFAPHAEPVGADHLAEPVLAVALAPPRRQLGVGPLACGGDEADEEVVGPDRVGQALAGGDGHRPVGAPAHRDLPVGDPVRHGRHHVGTEHVEHVVVLAVTAGSQGSEALHETQVVQAGHPVLGGVAVTEDHPMDLGRGEHPMPTKEAKDLSVTVGQRRRHVHDQPVRDPPPPGRSRSSHAHSPIQSGFSTGGPPAASACEDAS